MPAILSQLTAPIVGTNPIDVSDGRLQQANNSALFKGTITFNQNADTAANYSAYNMTVNGTNQAFNTGALIGSRLFINAFATGSTTITSFLAYAASLVTATTCTSDVTTYLGFNPTITHRGTGTVSTFGGVASNPTLAGGGATDGNVTTMYAYRSALANTSAAGVVATAYGLLVSAPGGTGTITTNYGANVSNQGRSGITTSYAYYAGSQSGATTSWVFYQAGGQSYLAAGAAGDVPVTVHGFSSQTGNLQEWENNSSVLQAGVSPTGVGIFNGLRLAVIAKTGAYTATTSDSIITGDTTSTGFTITLPTAVSVTGRIYIIKKIVAANTLTVGTTSSQTIDDAATQALTAQWEVLRVASNGTNWITF